jgi:hypothetical protein
MRAARVLLVLVAVVIFYRLFRMSTTSLRPPSTGVAASSPKPAAPVLGAIEPGRPADLTLGSEVLVVGFGVMNVRGPQEYEGHTRLRFSNESTGEVVLVELEKARDPTVVRALISKAEAERRLALLLDTTPNPDTRTAKERAVEQHRTLVRGTDEQMLTLLHRAYVSPFVSAPGEIDMLEEQVLPEIAHVLGMPSRIPGRPSPELVAKLHAAHAEHGTFAKSALPHPSEPPLAAPKDPWVLAGHHYVGTFTLEGDALVAGDPVYVTSKHDEPGKDVTKNLRLAATAGRWLCYSELDSDGKGDDLSFIAVHESAQKDFDGARKKATLAAKLWVDSGEMSIIDSAVRDDVAYDDARLFGGDDFGVIRGRGCKVRSGAGDGTYTTRVLARDGKAIYVHVDFTGESRDFMKDARAKLKLN